MKIERGQVAVVTGAATGMGRSLALQLAAKGCHLALCDVNMKELGVTAAGAKDTCPEIKITTHRVDVADEKQVLAFRDEVLGQVSARVCFALCSRRALTRRCWPARGRAAPLQQCWPRVRWATSISAGNTAEGDR